MKAVSTSRNQKSNTSRDAALDSEIITVSMPRSVAKRLQASSLDCLRNNHSNRNSRALPLEEEIAAIVNHGRGTDCEEINALSLEEYRVFEKALAVGAMKRFGFDLSEEEIEMICAGLQTYMSCDCNGIEHVPPGEAAGYWRGYVTQFMLRSVDLGDPDSKKEAEECRDEHNRRADLLERLARGLSGCVQEVARA